jgi:phosphoribosylanthranilate isomerase
MMVKICGITNRADAAAAVEAGASAVGFNFYSQSRRCITPEQAAEIAAGLPILKVGVFVNDAPARVEEIARIAGLDIAQLHGDETPQQMPNLTVWKAFRASVAWTPELFESYSADAYLLDGVDPGSGQPFPWNRVPLVGHRIILAGGLDDTNVGEAIRTLHLWGVDACSRLEKSPGIKDHQKVLRFVRAARGILS